MNNLTNNSMIFIMSPDSYSNNKTTNWQFVYNSPPGDLLNSL